MSRRAIATSRSRRTPSPSSNKIATLSPPTAATAVHSRGHLDASPNDVMKAFAVAGRIMYDAVRIGGMPCTGSPWRWGYGWPGC